MTKHKKAVSIAVAIVALVAVVSVSVVAYNNYRIDQDNKKIEAANAAVAERQDAFDNAASDEEKLTILRETLDGYNDYQNDENAFDEVETSYRLTIIHMRNYFTDKTQAEIEKYKQEIAQIDSIQDKAALEKSRDALLSLMETVKTQEGTVYADNDSAAVIDDLQQCVDRYNERISAIEAAEAEKARQEKEAAAKAAEEAAAAEAAAQSGYSDAGSYVDYSDSYSGGGSDGGSGGSGYSYSWRDAWSVDDNGNEIAGTRTHNDGVTITNPTTGESYDANDPVFS